MRLVLALALAVLASACTVVTTAEPLGTHPVALEPAEWDGTWLHAEGAVFLKVTDAAAGRMQLVALDESDGDDALTARTIRVEVLGHDGWLFANLVVDEEPDTTYWVRLKREGRQLLAWLPSPEAVAEVVRAGHLPGEVDEHGNVHLAPLDDAGLRVITDSTHGILVDWELPLALLRMSDKAGL